MHVDGTIGIGPGSLPEGMPSAFKSKRRNEAFDAELAPGDGEIRRLHEAYLPRAAAADPVNQEAVSEARELLKSGRLDTPEAARRAADAILTFGP